MTTALWPLQLALVQQLRAAAPLTALVTGVFDEVPEDTAHPYVTVGSITETVADGHNQRGLDAQVELHVWSRYPGYREAADILAALDAALDRQALTVSGFKDVSVAHQQHTELRDPDPDIRHINVSYRVWLTKA
ncbi:DUF3168 domain-containing protein [Streptomyces caniscabiei]|uniref:DUF3168 domain-containing protein n=1 Tax=Streptomyces caniscabiei TaxID=2746961 RepID=UPI0029AEE89E|nr:DUF3168 domain-containing protein [Streptomyces caniscabiei]MDX3507368.1 DUF3168 domain-containing protein [Streptomyces caniscabiei]